LKELDFLPGVRQPGFNGMDKNARLSLFYFCVMNYSGGIFVIGYGDRRQLENEAHTKRNMPQKYSMKRRVIQTRNM
jgi:hypothetical protein